MEILITGEKGGRIPRKLLIQTAETVLLSLGYKKKQIELSIVITNDKQIKKLNKRFRNKNKATDVLSFPLANSPYQNIIFTQIGDVVISLETARRFAKKENHSLSKELVSLLVHGILHLLGYDHENVSEYKIRKMMKLQQKLIEEVIKHAGIKR